MNGWTHRAPASLPSDQGCDAGADDPHARVAPKSFSVFGWLTTWAILLAYPAISFVYWNQVLASGRLPHDGDSIMIPIGESFLLAIVASPIILGAAWLCMRRFNPETRLLAWRNDRPWRSGIATLVCSALILAIVYGSVGDPPDLPWYEYLFSAYSALWIAWLLAMRAAVVEQLDPGRPSRTPSRS